MNKILFVFLLIPILAISQTKTEKIILDLKEKSRDRGIYIQSPNETPQPVFQFCEKWGNKIHKLNKLIKEEEINTLMSHENATLKFVGYLIETKRNNTKDHILQLLHKVTIEKKQYMAWGCNSNESSYSLQVYLVKVLSAKSKLFTPKFSLTNKELNSIIDKIKSRN